MCIVCVCVCNYSLERNYTRMREKKEKKKQDIPFSLVYMETLRGLHLYIYIMLKKKTYLTFLAR